MNRRRRKTSPAMPVWRRHALLGLFALVALTLQARLVWLQLFEGDYLTAEGDQRQEREVEMSAHRGLLLDRRGEPLGVSTPVDSIIVDPQRIPLDRDQIYELARAVNRDGAEVEREITSRMDRRYYRLRRGLAPADAAKVIKLGIQGVWSEREYKRFYPHAEVTCHILGFTGEDDAGQEGLELLYDYELAGNPGSKRVQRDERGRLLADVEQIKAPRPGRDIRLSLELRLQFEAYRALKAAVQESGAGSGSLVLLDVETGEVLVMVNQPACNPNDPEQRDDPASYRNRAITDIFEPGSTIKPLILATALESGDYAPETLIDVPKYLAVPGVRRPLTNDQVPLGIVSVTEILARSSNVGMGLIGLELDPAKMWRTLRAFGVGGSTEGGLGSLEAYGTLNNHSHWNAVGQATLSYGYGLSVTPLQLARAYAAIGSGGLLPPVSFKTLDEPPERVRVIRPEIAADLMTMLEAVVASDTGTAQRAEIPNYGVAGKTGTIRILESTGYSDSRHNAVFAGIAPASKPRFVAVVVINDPRGQAYYGGEVAAPVFAAVMSTALRWYGVAPDVVEETTLLSRAEVPQ